MRADSLFFNGGAETDGNLKLLAVQGIDILTGGRHGGDTIDGGDGADTLFG